VMVSWSSLNDMQSDLREFEKLGMVMEPKVICQRGKYHHDKIVLTRDAGRETSSKE
jgi:hypothetical protein